jgi:hypothetical protein
MNVRDATLERLGRCIVVAKRVEERVGEEKRVESNPEHESEKAI